MLKSEEPLLTPTCFRVWALRCLNPFLFFHCFCCLLENLKGSNWLNFFQRIFPKHYPSFRFAGRTIVQVNIYPSDRRINKNDFDRLRFLGIKAILSHCIKMMMVHLHSPSGGGARDLSLLPPIPRCAIVFCGKKKKRLNRILSILIRMTGRSLIFLLEEATVMSTLKLI